MIRGRGLNLAFTRTYNSAPSAAKVDLGLGYGWVHSYAMRLTSNDFGKCPDCVSAQAPENGNGKTASITYTDERGGDHPYLVNEATQAVTPPDGEFDALAFDTPVAGQQTLTFRNGTQYIFQTVGTGSLQSTPNLGARLIKIADPYGNQLNFSYNAAGRLATVSDNLGVTGRTGLVFSYDATNHLQSIADWSARTWRYSVNTGGDLSSYTNPLSQTIAYTYSPGSSAARHLLTGAAKPLRGVKTSFAYYQNGRTFNDHDALNNTETLDYDLFRKNTRVTDPRGGIREYQYDNAGRLTKLTEADGAILSFAATPDGLRYLKTDGLGYATQYSYRTDKSFNSTTDTAGQVTREQDALKQNVDMSYGPYDQVAVVKDKRGNIRNMSFHASTDGICKLAGKPDTTTIASLTVGGVVKNNVPLASYCWNSDGSLATQTDYLDPNDSTHTRVTRYVYTDTVHLNVDHVVMTGWDGASTSVSYTYDTLSRKTSETLARRTSATNAALPAWPARG